MIGVVMTTQVDLDRIPDIEREYEFATTTYHEAGDSSSTVSVTTELIHLRIAAERQRWLLQNG